MGEYAKGYRYEDAVLIGVDCSFREDESPVKPVAIADVIIHDKNKGRYYRGLELAAHEKSPLFFPHLSYGTYEPEERDLEWVRNRDPKLALWTSKEVDSFPYAKGFYARADLVEIIKQAGSLDLSPLQYHETRDDGTLFGFGNYYPLMRMMLGWHEIIKAYADPKLREYCKNGGDNREVFNLTDFLCSLGQNSEEDVMRVLLAVGEGINNDKWLQTYWKGVGDECTNLSLVREKVERFRKTFLGMK